MGGNFRAAATIWSKWKKAKHRREEKAESAADIVLAQDGRVRALMRWETDSILTSKIERIVGRDKVAFKMLAWIHEAGRGRASGRWCKTI